MVPEISFSPNFTYLNDNFLTRGLAVVILDATIEEQMGNFTDLLLSNKLLMSSSPCDLKTNLILKRNINLLDLIRRTSTATDFYFHFRNCRFEAVKNSRLIGPRPEFYSPHLEPAYSSWILMSQNYDTEIWHPLIMEGLIYVRQLHGGATKFQLSVRSECQRICPTEIDVLLTGGQGLLFTTDLFSLSYLPKSDLSHNMPSVSFITETMWN